VPIRVLIVDDTDSLRELLRSLCEEAGMDVVGEAADGGAAVALAAQQLPDAVILDVEMPIMDGLDALPRLKTAAPDAHVAVFSSRNDPETEVTARQRGADGYFVKGEVSSREVVAAVLAGTRDERGMSG